MTISTTGENQFSITFLMFNVLIFWVLKFLVLNKVFVNHSAMFVYTTIVLLALVTSFIYILINIYKTSKFEKITMKMSMYVEKHKSSLFMGNQNICFLRLKGKECEVYINHIYFVYTQRYQDRAEYISKLKARFAKLSKIDILFIYIYRYIREILTSISLFITWQICSIINNNTPSEMVFKAIVVILLILLYYTVIKMCLIAIKGSIDKRNLELFVSK